LQDNGRRSRVDLRLPAPPIPICRAQPLFSFRAREPFAFSRDRQRRACFQPPDESERDRSGIGRRAIQTPRDADDDGAETVVVALQPLDDADDAVDAVGFVDDLDRVEGTRQRACRIADRETDTPRADVDAENPHAQMVQFRALPRRAFIVFAASVPVFALFTAVFAVLAAAQQPTDRLQALQREADRLAAEERTLLGDVRKLEIERQLRATQVRQIDAGMASVQMELDSTAERIAALDQSARAAQPELRARLVEIYKLGGARYVRLLLATADVRRIGQAARTVGALAEIDRQRVAAYQRTLDDLKAAQSTLSDRSARLAALRTDAERAQAAAARAAQARNSLVGDIDRRRDLNAQLAGELQTAQQKLQIAVRDMPATGASTAPMRAVQGQLEWPADGAVRARFAQGGAIQSNGIVITTAEGAAAVAVHDGTVAFAGPFTGFGNLVILDHGAQTFSLYGDLLDIAVRKGDRIDRGRRVGTVGPTPTGTAGLYFELRVDGRPVDPLQWLKKRPL
jgi:septal ring factor EnvC (AmiA/AmiB activator)